MKEVSVYDAVGKVLIHDLTQIIPGEYKGSRFKKGHVIREEDIEKFLEDGEKASYVLEKEILIYMRMRQQYVLQAATENIN